MPWSDVAREQPRLCQFGKERLIASGEILVATTRRDRAIGLSPSYDGAKNCRHPVRAAVAQGACQVRRAYKFRAYPTRRQEARASRC
jgi:hypothetical protein